MPPGSTSFDRPPPQTLDARTSHRNTQTPPFSKEKLVGFAIFLPHTGERRHNTHTATVRPNYYHSSTGADSAPVQERDID